MSSLIYDVEQTEYGLEGKMLFDLFQKEIEVHISDEETMEYANKCAEYLCNMPQEMLLPLCTYFIRYCEEFRELLCETDMPVPENVSGMEILKYVTPQVLIVDKPTDFSVIGFHMECSCDWEPEHGLEFTIKADKIRYVGSFDGMSPWNEGRMEYVGFYDAEEDMNMNYADKEEELK